MSDIVNTDDILKKFELRRPLYEKFGLKLNEFLSRKLKEKEIDDALIKDRPKSLTSFKQKITRPDKNYSDPLNQITDLTGVRITVLYSDQIQLIESIIKSEFKIDFENSIDKSKNLKPNTFGYLSIHYIISLNQNKESHNEWKEYCGLKAEIQIRTSLQDAWAKVSHALDYKNETDVPDNLKRRLFRLAGLFELADEEFERVKNESLKRLVEVKKLIEQEKTGEIDIDFLSISQFLSSSTMMREAIEYASIYRILGSREILAHYNKSDCSLVTEECSRLKIENIEMLENILRQTEAGNDEFFKQISHGRIWKATHAFILFLLIMKAFPQKFEANYLVNKYGWDYIVAKGIIESATKIQNKYNYSM